MKVLDHKENCTGRTMLLLLELKEADRKNNDSVYLVPCSNGMKKHLFWNHMACSTLTEGGGRERDFVSCRSNEILSPDATDTNVLPVWVPVVCTVLALSLLLALLTVCVLAYQLCHHRTRRVDVQRR